MKKLKFRLATLGCRTNQYETQAYRDQLLALGHTEAHEGQEADLCIVNTCTVTHQADSSSRRQIRQLKRANPQAKIVVTGCMAPQKEPLLEEVASTGLVVLNEEKEQLINKIFPNVENLPEFSIKNFEAHTRAFVKVQDGCNSFCTYCIIPYVRGRSRCRPISQVLAEVKELVNSGYQEVVITGINVGDYEDEGKNLSDLVRAVDGIEGLSRVRISSIDPDEVDDGLLSAVVEGRHTCPSMHIVLQSGSNVVLKRMNRKYTRQMFMQTVERLRHANPDFTFTTDIIVGFPGETEQDFEETLQVIREVGFAKVHIFPYSSRERTRAHLFEDKIAPEVIAERKARALRVCNHASFLMRQKYVGKQVKVLTESAGSEGAEGHTDHFLFVKIPKVDCKPNTLLDVRLVGNDPESLIGEVVE